MAFLPFLFVAFLATTEAKFNKDFVDFIQYVSYIYDIQTIIVKEEVSCDFIVNSIISETNIPIVHGNLSSIYLRSSTTLSIVIYDESTTTSIRRDRNILKTIFLDISESRQEYNVLENLKGSLNSVHIHKHNGTMKIHIVWPFQYSDGPKVVTLDKSENPFPNKFQNIVNYELKTYLALDDIPRYFRYKDKFTGKDSYGGISAEIFFSFVESLNLTLKPIEGDILERDTVIHQAVVNIKSVDVELFPYLNLHLTENRHFEASYPVDIVGYCLLVPVQSEIPKYFYILRPLTPRSWTILVFSTLFINFVLIGVSKVLKRNHREYSHPFLQALSLTINFPSKNIYKPSGTLIWIYMLLFSYGLILSNLYNAWLSSMMVAQVPGDQIETIEDVLEDKLKIWISPATKTFLEGNEQLEKLEDNLVQKHFDDIIKHQLKYNVSQGYVVSTDTWRFLDLPQMAFKYQKLRITDICFKDSFAVFILKKGSYFYEPLNNHMMTLLDSGLYHHFIDKTIEKSIMARIFDMKFKKDSKFKPLKLSYLRLVFIFLITLSFINLLVFMCECLLKKFLNF